MNHTLEGRNGSTEERKSTGSRADQWIKFSSEPDRISIRQVNIAMACLDLETNELAEATGLDPKHVEKVAAGHADPQTVQALRSFFETAGIVFALDENGKVGVLYEP